MANTPPSTPGSFSEHAKTVTDRLPSVNTVNKYLAGVATTLLAVVGAQKLPRQPVTLDQDKKTASVEPEEETKTSDSTFSEDSPLTFGAQQGWKR